MGDGFVVFGTVLEVFAEELDRTRQLFAQRSLAERALTGINERPFQSSHACCMSVHADKDLTSATCVLHLSS